MAKGTLYLEYLHRNHRIFIRSATVSGNQRKLSSQIHIIIGVIVTVNASSGSSSSMFGFFLLQESLK